MFKVQYITVNIFTGFTRTTAIKFHMRLHTGEGSNSQREKRIYDCTECEKSFTKKVYYLSHLHNVHKIDTYDGKQIPDSSAKCDTCHKIFSSIATLQKHKLTHGERNFLCNYCGKTCFR